MKNANGFALIVTLLFVLLLTLFGFSVLLLATNYYASTRNLFEKENARIACDQALRLMVDRHNLEESQPRFFHDSRIWSGQRMVPFRWNDHEMTASLNKNWSLSETNVLTAASRKGRHSASRMVEIRQRRLEDFALYSDAEQDLQNASLFDGPVFVRSELRFAVSGSAFRQPVQAVLNPPDFAVLRRKNLQTLPYPELRSHAGPAYFQQEALAGGYSVTSRNPVFWASGSYQLNLDLLKFEEQPPDRWRLIYNHVDLAVVSQLILWFDDSVQLSQHSAPPAFLLAKPAAPVYIASAGNLRLFTGIHAMEGGIFRHPVLLASSEALYIDAKAPRALSMDAVLVSFGLAAGLIIEPGGASLSEVERESFFEQSQSSAFLVEDELRSRLRGALDSDERILWFRGGLLLSGTWQRPEEVVHLHFQSGRDAFPLLPSLPFVYIVEGSERWL